MVCVKGGGSIHREFADKIQAAECRSLEEQITYSWDLLNRVIDRHNPVVVLGLFSGGKDSTTFMHLFRHRLDAAVHINTGIGVEETRQFVRDTCASWNLPLIENHPPPGATYRELVLKYGFPGPAGHQLMYSRLKERGLRQARRYFITNGREQRVMFVAGMRYFESNRRMGNTEETHREGSTVWCSPICWWTTANLVEYRQQFDVPHNEVTDHLHMSGECLCGCFAKPGELDQLRFFYPETAAMIDELEREAKAAGVHHHWGTRPPRNESTPSSGPVGPLCQKCEVLGLD